jgi:SAM-dependent methyltransferase
VLELGCGIGTYSARIRSLAQHLVCVDAVPRYVAEVRRVFRDDPAVEPIVGTMGSALGFAAASFDAIACLNVLEHVEDEAAALLCLRRCLKPGGTLALQVPAHQALYGSVDRALGHYRRYNARQLAALLEETGFAITLPPRYLYSLAIPGWWWFGKVRKAKAVPGATARIANALVRTSRALERLLPLPFGLTLVSIASAPDGG